MDGPANQVQFDIPAIRVTGAVTLMGNVLPNAGRTRGAARFSLVPGGSATTGSFAPTGAASYAVTLIPGNYVIGYAANPELCDPTPAGAGPPCSDQIVKGCP